MSSMIQNAFVTRADNSVTVLGAMLLPHFFDVNAEDAVNYGRIGVVMAHEMTHNFDDQGRQCDAHGNLVDWWTAPDAARFDEAGQCLIQQFDQYVAVDDVHEERASRGGRGHCGPRGRDDRAPCIPEDAAGSFRRSRGGHTPEQRFFSAYAQLLEFNMRSEEMRRQALGDTHPLARFRVIGSLSNLREFANAYSCPVGAPMVRPKPCKIW